MKKKVIFNVSNFEKLKKEDVLHFSCAMSREKGIHNSTVKLNDRVLNSTVEKNREYLRVQSELSLQIGSHEFKTNLYLPPKIHEFLFQAHRRIWGWIS